VPGRRGSRKHLAVVLPDEVASRFVARRVLSRVVVRGCGTRMLLQMAANRQRSVQARPRAEIAGLFTPVRLMPAAPEHGMDGEDHGGEKGQRSVHVGLAISTGMTVR